MRKKIIAGNWKMHFGPREAGEFLTELLGLIEPNAHKTWLVFPPTVSLPKTQQLLKDGFVQWGAQNCHWETKGAFTGETSIPMLRELGCSYALVGHSERRQYFAETNQTCSKKIKALAENGIIPMYCIGETLAERESGKTEEILTTQLQEGLSLWDKKMTLTIAYEPVWAIGTGKTATPDQVEKAHELIRSVLNRLSNGNTAGSTQILYGGSVKPETSRELGALPNVDGFLVGGASLVAKSFAQIGSI